MESSLTALVQLAARLSGMPLQDCQVLATRMLSTSAGGPWKSTLNNDGSPLEVCIGLARDSSPPAIRLIADPAAQVDSDTPRYSRRDEALKIISASHAPGLLKLCQTLIEDILPDDESLLTSLPNSGAWLAADLSGRGMAIYTTARWGSVEARWLRARNWLDRILPDTHDTRSVLKRLSSRTVLVSAGLEGYSRQRCLAKLYWRLIPGQPLNSLGIPLCNSPLLSRFMSLLIGDQVVAVSGILGSVGFNVGSGDLSSIKLDICCHCVRHTPEKWAQLLQACVDRYGLAAPAWDWPGLFVGSEMAFIGLGLNMAATPHLNIYLKPLGVEKAAG